MNIYLATSLPVLGPVPVGLMIWLFALSLAVVFILAEMERTNRVSVTRRVMAFIFGAMAWTSGLAPWDYTTQYANGTIAAVSVNPFGTGSGLTGTIIFVVDTGIFAWTMLLVLQILIEVANRKRPEA